jgi:CTP synthase
MRKGSIAEHDTEVVSQHQIPCGDCAGLTEIRERHRHRFEFNKAYESCLTEKGLVVAGKTPDGKFVEVAELPDHPWYVAVQFHPEFKSKPRRPHPLFAGFVEASFRHKEAAPAVDASAEPARGTSTISA